MAKHHRNIGKVAQPSYMGRSLFRQYLERLELDDLGKAAEFLHMHPRTVRRLLTGESPIDARLAMLLHVLVKQRISPLKAMSYLE